MSKEGHVASWSKRASTVSILCLVTASAQVLVSASRLYSSHPATPALVLLFIGGGGSLGFGILTLVHVHFLGRAGLPPVVSKPTGLNLYLFFWIFTPLLAAWALADGISGSVEATAAALQFVCLVLMFTWPFLFVKAVAPTDGNR